MTSPAEKLEEIGVGSATDELAPGTRLLGGQFTIDSFLNAGGFGITYLARDSLDRRVVVKECFPSSFCRRSGTLVAPRTRQRADDFRSVVRLFVQEAMTLSRLQHANIVKVHQVFEDNETAYMAMEYIDGPDLLETVEGSAPALAPGQVHAILEQMLDAIGYVHAQGVLHRDISPDNILLDRNTGRPVLIDFGASRKDVTRKSRALSGLRVVKDGYSPQEFYIGGSLQGPNSDLYALAATFCHLVTGTTPKTSQERLSAIASRQGDPQPPVMGRAKGYPVEFLKAIDKGMAIFPRDRFQSVAEWQAALRADAKRPILASVTSTPDRVAAVAHPIAATLAPTSAAPAAADPAIAAPAAAVAAPAPAALAPAAADPAIATPAPAVAAPAAPAPVSAAPVSGADLAQPKPAAPVMSPAPIAANHAPRDLLVPSAAAVLLLVGLLSLPGDLVHRIWGPTTMPVPADTARTAASSVEQVELANGIVLETIETANGSRAVVSVLPEGAATDLEVGDVLLVYAATGEMIESATAVQSLLSRETANGVGTFGFAVQRDGKMAVGNMALPDLGKVGLDMKNQDLESKS